MAVTYDDLLDGNGAEYTKDGWEIKRIAIVTDVPGYGIQMLYNAYSILGITRGMQHPVIGSARLKSVVHVIRDSNTVEFTMLYRDPPQPSVSISSAKNQIETNLDRDGNPIILEYTYPTSYPQNADLQDITVKTGGLINKSVSDSVITFTREEVTTQLTLINKQLKFMDKINSVQWNLSDGNNGYQLFADVKTWICDDISASSEDSGYSFNVSYTFRHKNRIRIIENNSEVYYDGFRSYITFIRDDGKPADDIESTGQSGVADKLVNVYDEVDFNELGL